jgi:hypothetical protein
LVLPLGGAENLLYAIIVGLVNDCRIDDIKLIAQSFCVALCRNRRYDTVADRVPLVLHVRQRYALHGWNQDVESCCSSTQHPPALSGSPSAVSSFQRVMRADDNMVHCLYRHWCKFNYPLFPANIFLCFCREPRSHSSSSVVGCQTNFEHTYPFQLISS